MKVKDFKEIINALPDNWEIGYNKVTEEGNVNTWFQTHFVPELENFNIDVENKRVILYTRK